MTIPKKSILQLKPYINGKHSSRLFQQSARIMKLDSNESSVSPSPAVSAALIEFIRKLPLNWYPDIHSKALVEKLASYTKCPKNFIQTFNGSDNALETICRTYIQPGDEVILCMPTYDHFRVYAETCDALLVPVFGPSPFVPKVEGLISALTDKTKIIYIVNPNNPTGMTYSQKDIRCILAKAPRSIVIVDEAYHEFCGITMTALLEKFKNIIITRSFSKAFGLAGLRCGYILTQPSNMESINKVRIGKNINSLAQTAACAALDDLEYMYRYVSEVRTARKWLSDKLKHFGLTVVDTEANFLLVGVTNPKSVQDFLEKHNVYIRDRSIMPQLEGFIRITIGHQLLMERFWNIFAKTPSSFLFSEKKGVKATCRTAVM